MADLRLASYNIKSAQHVANGLDAVAATLRALDADVVSVQEVDRGTERSNRTDQTAELAERVGFDTVGRGPTFDGEESVRYRFAP